MKNTHKITGALHRISETRTVGRGQRLRSFVLRWEEGEGHELAELVFKGDNVVTLDSYKAGHGDEVEAEFFVSGREWTNPKTGETRVFTDLVCCGLVLL